MARIGYKLRQTGAEVQAAIDKIIALGPASASVAGLMTPEDKQKLDSVGIHYDTTAHWNAMVGYIPGAGEIIIYSDYKTVEGVDIPGIKIGSGNGYVQDLAFIDEADTEALLAHISNTNIHTSAQEKQFWNAKLNVDEEVEEETLVFNRN